MDGRLHFFEVRNTPHGAGPAFAPTRPKWQDARAGPASVSRGASRARALNIAPSRFGDLCATVIGSTEPRAPHR
jgi:hypothetical protein